MVQSLVLPGNPGYAMTSHFGRSDKPNCVRRLWPLLMSINGMLCSPVRNDTRASPVRPSTCRAAAKSSADLRPQFCHRKQLQRMLEAINRGNSPHNSETERLPCPQRCICAEMCLAALGVASPPPCATRLTRTIQR